MANFWGRNVQKDKTGLVFKRYYSRYDPNFYPYNHYFFFTIILNNYKYKNKKLVELRKIKSTEKYLKRKIKK